MSALFRTCEDGQRCENGALCVEDPNDEGSFYCNCATASGDFAGLFCEYEAETYCRFPQEVSSDWFCTNQGTCVVGVRGDSSQWKCDCPPDYDGPHCEYVKGAMPQDWPGQVKGASYSSTGGGGLETGVMIAIIVVCVFVVGMLTTFIVWKLRSRGDGTPGQNAPKDKSEAVNIDMDGGALVQAMNELKSQGPKGGSDLFDDPSGLSVEVDDDSYDNGYGNGNGHHDYGHTNGKANGQANGSGHGHIL